MLNPYFEQKNYIPQETAVTWKTQGYSSLGIDVTGTFTSGSFVLQGSNDGTTWTTLDTANSSGIVVGGTVSTTGHYTFNILGFNVARCVQTSIVGTLTLSALGTVEVASVFASEGGGVSSVTAALPLLSSGGSTPQISVSGLSTLGTALQGMFMNAAATALEWVGATGTGSIVRAASPTFTGTITAAEATFTGPVMAPNVGLNGVTILDEAFYQARSSTGRNAGFKWTNAAQNKTWFMTLADLNDTELGIFSTVFGANVMRIKDDGGVVFAGVVTVGNGATGTFLSADAKTVTVTAGIITSIV